MGYNKSPFKMAPKSPIAKALKGNQENLNAGLKAAIEAAAESPAKQTIGPKVNKALTPKPSAVVESAKPTKPAPKYATKTRVKKIKGDGK